MRSSIASASARRSPRTQIDLVRAEARERAEIPIKPMMSTATTYGQLEANCDFAPFLIKHSCIYSTIYRKQNLI